MTTALELTRSALRLIKVASEMSPASADQEKGGFEALKDMINEWAADGIKIGVYAPTRIDEDLQEPDWATGSLKYLLAEKIAADYERVLSDNVLKLIDEAKDRIQAKSTISHASPYQSNLPMGQGNRRGPQSRAFFSGKDPAA